MAHPDPDSTVILTTTRTEVEAQLLLAKLDAAGIRAEASGGLSSGMRTEAPGEVRILVLARDLDEARRVLRQHDEDPDQP